jgi:hypothetical protein
VGGDGVGPLGHHREASLDLALTGRRTAECELEIMLLLERTR